MSPGLSSNPPARPPPPRNTTPILLQLSTLHHAPNWPHRTGIDQCSPRTCFHSVHSRITRERARKPSPQHDNGPCQRTAISCLYPFPRAGCSLMGAQGRGTYGQKGLFARTTRQFPQFFAGSYKSDIAKASLW